MKYIQAESKEDGKFTIPVVDVRESERDRKIASRMVKAANGNNSKFIPGKWGYGPLGPKKY